MVGRQRRFILLITSAGVRCMSGENGDGAWQRLGTHAAHFEPPDVIAFRANGDITLDDVRIFVRMLSERPKPDRGFFYLSNLTKFGRQSAKAFAEMKTLPPDTIRATAVVGAAFRQKVFVELLTRVGKVLGLRMTESLPVFLDSEEQAYAWFDKLRNGES